MADLKPCPFCKSNSISIKSRIVENRGNEVKRQQKHRIYCACNKCFARSKPIKTDWVDKSFCNRFGSDSEYNTDVSKWVKLAVEEWNKRIEAVEEKNKETCSNCENGGQTHEENYGVCWGCGNERSNWKPRTKITN